MSLGSATPTVSKRDVVKLPHHEQAEFCTTRPAYRQGKKLTAVKVYTASSESQHLVVSNVPALGLTAELRRLATRFGAVKSLVPAARFETESFTDAFHLQYARIASARHGKRQLDSRNFYGGSLLAAFAPELESVAETRAKLDGRRRDVARRAVRPIGGQRRARPLPSEQWPANHVLQSKRLRLEADNEIPSSATVAVTTKATSSVAMTTRATSSVAVTTGVEPPISETTVPTTTAPAWSARPKLVPRQVTIAKRIVYRTPKAPS